MSMFNLDDDSVDVQPTVPSARNAIGHTSASYRFGLRTSL